MINKNLLETKLLTWKLLINSNLKKNDFFKIRINNILYFIILTLIQLNGYKKTKSILIKNKKEFIDIFNNLNTYVQEKNVFEKIDQVKFNYEKLIENTKKFNNFSLDLSDFLLKNKLFDFKQKKNIDIFKLLFSQACLYFIFNSIDNYFSIKIENNISSNYDNKVKFAINFCHLTKEFQNSIRNTTKLNGNEIIVVVNKIIKKMY